MQYLGYAILTKSNFIFSQILFNDIVNNHNNIAKGKGFLIHPRFLSLYLQNQLPGDESIIGPVSMAGALSHETFTRISNQDKVSKTQV